MNGLQIAGANVKKQLNGNCMFVLLEGTEKAVIDAHNTLYTANAVNAVEPEFLYNEGHKAQAVTITSVAKFKRGLFNREIFHLMDDINACNSNKHRKGGFAQLARQKAEELWQNMESCRVITDDSSASEPYLYKMGDNSTSDSDMSGRD